MTTPPRESDNLRPSVLSDEIFVWWAESAARAVLFISTRKEQQVAGPGVGWDEKQQRVGCPVIDNSR